MALILNLETATKNCSVALAKDGALLALREYAGDGYAHAEKLHVFIEEVFKDVGLTLNNLDAVAVSMGPGSYTGLRIGVSAAKGLCYSLKVPLIAVDTLHVLALQIKIDDGVVIPMIDARRMEAYTAIFDKDYNKVRETRADIIAEHFFDAVEGPVNLLGDGAGKYRSVLPEGKFIYHDAVYPSALQMMQLADDKYKISDTVDVAYFEPYYLKDFVADK